VETSLVDVVFALLVVVPALGLIAMRLVRTEKPRSAAPDRDLSGRGRRLLQP
jgi:Tfp pilus assembly protein PilX